MRHLFLTGARRLLALAMLPILAACSQPDIRPGFVENAKALDPQTFECCFDPEKFYPEPVARLALAIGNDVGPMASQAAYGDYEAGEFPGRLTGKADAQAGLLSRLRPLDILLTGNASYTVGRLMPGRFSHSAVYLGTEAQLRAAGLWNLPEMRPLQAGIREGKTIIESAWPAVALISPEKFLEVDRVLAIRPALSAADKRGSASRLAAAIGTPFNYALALDPTLERFVCTGLLHHSLQAIDFNEREAYGATVLFPDDIAAQAIRGEQMKVIAYVLGNDGPGFTFRSTYALMVDIAAFWGFGDA